MVDSNLILLRGQEQARVNVSLNSEREVECQKCSLDMENQPYVVDQALMDILKMTKKTKPLSKVKPKASCSAFWKGLLKSKDEFFQRDSFKIGNGEIARFWEDTWLGDSPLSHQYLSLYCIVQRKQVFVANILSQRPIIIGFRRALSGSRGDR
jgi:hypothetical protein